MYDFKYKNLNTWHSEERAEAENVGEKYDRCSARKSKGIERSIRGLHRQKNGRKVDKRSA